MTPVQMRSLLLHTLVAAKLITDPVEVVARGRANVERLSRLGRQDAYWVDRWRRVLDLPAGDVALFITERTQDAADMRQGTPFTGVLTTDERLAALERSPELG